MMKIRRRYRFHLTTGRSVEGVLVKRGRVIELADPRVEINGKLVSLTDRVFLPAERVEFAQSVTSS